MKKFEQMKRLYNTMVAYVNPMDYSDDHVSGLTSDFDRLFELSWKTMKEYMFQDLGMIAAKTGSPREILGLALQQGLIREERLWSDMLHDRNDDTHNYNILVAYEYKNKIEKVYLEVMKELIDELSLVIPAEEGQVPLKPPTSLVIHVLSESDDIEERISEYCNKLEISIEELYKNWDEKYSKMV